MEPYPEPNGLTQTLRRSWNQYVDICQKAIDWYKQQSIQKKILIGLGLVVAAALVVLLALFHVYFIQILITISDWWAEFSYGRILLFVLVFFVGFPPLIGFSAMCLLSGMVYGIVGGWLVVSVASITGSFASFLFFRYILKERSERLLQSNEMFRLFAETIKQDRSLLLLILIRLCPLPYSLSNGALAAIPELSPTTYFLASLITCPKMFAHTFVGHQIKDIGDDDNTTARKIVDLVTILITAMASGTATYIIYHQMKLRLNKYHSEPNEDYNEMIFGDFGDDESGNNLELNSAEFDADNFIIEDEEDSSSKKTTETTPFSDNLDSQLDEPLDNDIDTPKRAYRDY